MEQELIKSIETKQEEISIPSTDESTIPPQTSKLRRVWKFIYRSTLVIGVLTLAYYLFLIPMQVAGQNPIDPFVVGQQIFSERISFLFREPKVGDAVIFKTPTVGDVGTSNVMTYFGIITKIADTNNIKTFQIISTKTQSNPWEVSRDKIIGRIYYPSTKSLSTPVISATPPSSIADISPSPTVLRSPTPTITPNPDSNIKTFTSSKLGVTFEYQVKYKGSNEVISTKEVGNKVYVYSNNMSYDQGQYLEVFDKDIAESLIVSINKIIMKGYSPSDCLVTQSSNNLSGSQVKLPSSYSLAKISVPSSPGDDMENLSVKADKCPKPYTAVGGLNYFLMDQDHPSEFVFLSIGQYALNAGDNITWQDTIKFTN